MESIVGRPKSTGVNKTVMMAPSGAKVIGVLTLVRSIYMIIMQFALPVMEGQWEKQSCIFNENFNFADPSFPRLKTISMVIAVTIGGLQMTVSAVLLAGISKKLPEFMLPFLIWNSLSVIFLISGMCYSFFARLVTLHSLAVCIIPIIFEIGLYSYFIVVIFIHRREIMNLNLLPIGDETVLIKVDQQEMHQQAL